MANKKILTVVIFLLISPIVYSKQVRKYKLPEECVYSESYKTFLVNKKESAELIIEKELFGQLRFDSVFKLSFLKGGIPFDYHFYKVDDDNICLGIETSNGLQDESVIFVNTQKECGTKCNVYLDKAEDSQIYYLWEPNKEIITDRQKEKLVIKTKEKTYTVYLRTGIKELELTGCSKIKSIKGLNKFPYLTNLSLIGFDL